MMSAGASTGDGLVNAESRHGLRTLVGLVSCWFSRIHRRRSEAGGGAMHGFWRMASDDTLRLRPGSHGLALRCHSGTFLVTQARDPLDHVLEPGCEFRSSGRGLVVAWALSNGSITVNPEMCENPPPAQRMRGEVAT